MKGQDVVSDGFVFNDQDFNQHFWTLKNKVLVAGVRLSIVLSRVLETQSGGALRKGSNIVVPVDVDVIVGSRTTPLWMRNLLLNSGIFLAVVFLLWVLFIRSGSARQATQSTASVTRKKERVH